MFIDFEGIDGSGKTTLSNRVAERLRARGLQVVHARANGELPSALAQQIRAITRSADRSEMTPETELLLNAARESQLLAEVIRPALARGAVVIADRSLDSHLAMAQARGIPRERARAVLDAIAAGGWADLVVLVDVDPEIARLRKRAGRLEDRKNEPPGRKGQAGTALLHRMREALHEAAAAQPERFVVVRNEEADLDTLESQILAAIEKRLDGAQGPRPILRRRLPAAPMVDPAPIAMGSPAELEAALLERVRSWAAADPACAALLLGGICTDASLQMRRELAPRAPAAVAMSLAGLPVGIDLLEQLAAQAPRSVARALEMRTGARAMALRQRLAESHPLEVAASLVGLRDDAAWALRERLWEASPAGVLQSLAGDDTAPAWALRNRAVTEKLPADLLLPSLAGLDDERAWAWRHEGGTSLPALLRSIRGCTDERAWELRRRWLEAAPRPVLKGIFGIDSEPAWELRWRAGAGAGEVLDSLGCMAGPRAHSLRAELSPFFPARVLLSLPPDRDAASEALLREVTERWGGHLLVLRAAVRVLCGNGGVREEEAA